MRASVVLVVALGCRPTAEPGPVAPAPPPATRVPDTVVDVGATATDPEMVKEPPVAMVGNTRVGWDAFQRLLQLKLAKYVRLGATPPDVAVIRYRKTLAERFVYAEQVRQEAYEVGVEFDESELEERTEAARRGIRDFDLHLQRRGETDGSLRALMETELRELEIIEATGGLEVDEAMIKTEYEAIKGNWVADEPRVRVSHILIPRDTPDAAKKAARVHKLATAKGADFAALAREHSAPPTRDKGGDIGIFTRDRMAPEFAAAAFKLKVGQISAPVRTKFGWHVIRVTGRWPAGPLPLSALRDQIEGRLQARQRHTGRRDLRKRLARERPATWFVVLDPQRSPRPDEAIGRPSVDDGTVPRRREPLD